MSMELFTTLNSLVGLGTLALQILAVTLFVLYLRGSRDVEMIVAAWAIPVSFLLVLASTALSLVYSMYFGLVPCPLCWMQRVFLYPQLVLFAVALYIKDARVYVYAITLSLVGAAVALYQHALQMFGTGSLPCPASPGADCAKRIIFEMGYITFPLAAFSTFALIMVIMLFLRRAYVRGSDSTSR